MTIYYVNTGSSPNAGDGDSLRVAFNKVNANFAAVEQQFTDIVQGTTSSISNGSYSVAVRPDGNVVFNTQLATFNNGSDAVFTLSAESDGANLNTLPGQDFYITTNLHDHEWRFTYDGKLVFPDGTIQTTAASTATAANTGNWIFSGNNQ